MSELFLHDSATRTKKKFVPLDPQHVKIYVCGPTVYYLAHLGNARPVVVFDVLNRLLRTRYSRVTYVRNITDVDDKINAQAKLTDQTIQQITQKTTADFHEDMRGLNTLPPDVEPRATQHVSDMISLIERLISNGHAYVAQGHVLFHVKSYASYGSLSGRTPAELQAGARVDVAPYKRDAGDFVLWKPSDEETPGWDSPWGRGRPGWHIECSAMSWKHLGESFDIHGGGHDLIFPHHENEVAQSVCAFPGAAFARYWMHNGMLLVDGEKMSKSLGNFLTVRDILKKGAWAGEAFRLLLLRTHYRQALDFTEAGLDEAKAELDDHYAMMHRTQIMLTQAESNSVSEWLLEPLWDDLNTVLAVKRLRDVRTLINALTVGGDTQVTLSHMGWNQLPDSSDLLKGFKRAIDALGILQSDPTVWIQGPENSDHIQAAIVARQQARRAKNWAEADRIRENLAANGVILEDHATGTTWKRLPT